MSRARTRVRQVRHKATAFKVASFSGSCKRVSTSLNLYPRHLTLVLAVHSVLKESLRGNTYHLVLCVLRENGQV